MSPSRTAEEDRPISTLPSALDRMAEIVSRLGNRDPAVFIDYDGTLTPIVDDPRTALLDPATRDVLEQLTQRCAVAVVSGRDLDEVRELVGLEALHYVGSHGFDILEVDGTRHRWATSYLPALHRCARALEEALADVPGAWMERKGFAVAVHFRAVEHPDAEARMESIVDRVAAEEPGLRKTRGRKVLELRPDVEWDKGRAVSWMLHNVIEASDTVPFYIGDDETDEDAFRSLGDRGLTIVVRGRENARTAASYALSGPGEVREFLSRLTRLVAVASGG